MAAKKPKSKVNEAGNYTKPGKRKAQLLASEYKKAGGGYKN